MASCLLRVIFLISLVAIAWVFITKSIEFSKEKFNQIKEDSKEIIEDIKR